jgi:hypothetical protein
MIYLLLFISCFIFNYFRIYLHTVFIFNLSIVAGEMQLGSERSEIMDLPECL